jgi:hypothetical protein
MVSIGGRCTKSMSITTGDNSPIFIDTALIQEDTCTRIPSYLIVGPIIFLLVVIIIIIGCCCYHRRRQANRSEATIVYHQQPLQEKGSYHC